MSAGKVSGGVASAAKSYFHDIAHLPSRLQRRAFKTESYEEMRISAQVASENPMKRVSPTVCGLAHDSIAAAASFLILFQQKQHKHSQNATGLTRFLCADFGLDFVDIALHRARE